MDLQQLTIEKLSAAGYVYIGMDHFARPNDPLVIAMNEGTLHRSFQGYTTHMQCELVGIGVSSIGEIGNCLYQNEKTLDEYYLAMDQEKLPVSRGIALSEDDRIRQHIIMTIMCCGRIDKKEFESSTGYLFDNYFSRETIDLEKLDSDGLVDVNEQYIDVTDTGRFMLRNIAMIFDQYRHPAEHGNRFSKTV
jgi:oxygen-independent coproporphyrinogen-3 oxidase